MLSALRDRDALKPQPKADEVLVAIGATTVTSACGMMRRADTVLSRLVLGLLRDCGVQRRQSEQVALDS